MDITLELATPYPAWARLYSKMGRQFAREYEGSVKSRDATREQHLELAMGDISREYVFWIVLKGRKIGYAMAPYVDDRNGKRIGRYLDTRWIEPKYRGRGIGTKVWRILQQEKNVKAVKIRGTHLADTFKFWHSQGFRRAYLAGIVDPSFKPEIVDLNHHNQDPLVCHYYLYDETMPSLKDMDREGVPYLDLNDAPGVKEA